MGASHKGSLSSTTRRGWALLLGWKIIELADHLPSVGALVIFFIGGDVGFVFYSRPAASFCAHTVVLIQPTLLP
jgi:hypothetical protein